MSRLLRPVSLTLVVLAAIVWLGGLNVRAMVGFNMLETGTLDFKTNIHPYVERTVFSLLAQSSLLLAGAYVVLWIAGIVYLRTTALRFKDHGWLAMSAILFYLFTPVEIYTMVLDFRMWYLDVLGSNDLTEYRKLFIHRLAALAGVPMVALLSYYTAIVLCVVRPMRRRDLSAEVPPISTN